MAQKDKKQKHAKKRKEVRKRQKAKMQARPKLLRNPTLAGSKSFGKKLQKRELKIYYPETIINGNYLPTGEYIHLFLICC
jgi:hypothetical protein